MFVCICNAIRECEFKTAALATGCDAAGVYARLGKRPQCGQCIEEADDLLEGLREAFAVERIAA